MKSIYPAFRGYVQQDAQEFLRVFMDKMHNENKVLSSTAVNNNQLKIESGDCHSVTTLLITLSNFTCVHLGSEASTHTNRKVGQEYRSIISGIFQGKLANSVTCLQCESISHNDDYFEDLSLPIANNSKPNNLDHKWWPWHSKPLSITNKISNKNQTNSLLTSSNAAVNLLFYQLSWIFALLLSLKNWFSNHTVTLEQCLELFFSQNELNGDNKYSCGRCNGHQNATMQSKLVVSPEILCLHLKRFQNDFGFSKNTTSIRFPVDGLDMNQYLHPNHADNVHLYDLIGVICHYSSGGGGGHYTAYVLSWRSQSWYEFDDDQVNEVDVNVVMGLTSSAYVLFYKKRDDDMIQIREHADKLLKTTFAKSVFKYYIHRSWVVRFNTFAEPGPINNYEFLCIHGAIQPDKYPLIHETTIEVSQKTWAYLFDVFGGGPTCTSLHICSHCEKERNRLIQRMEAESATFSKLHTLFESTNPSKDVHVLSLAWFRKWEEFIKGISNEPPGPIDNRDILYTSKCNSDYLVNPNSDYGWISWDTWNFFHGIYGGGPRYNMCPSTATVDHNYAPLACLNNGEDDVGTDGDDKTPALVL